MGLALLASKETEMDCPVLYQQRSAGSRTVTKYLVAYARIQSDKDSDITLQGVFFGGIGESLQEADTIARECVNTIKGGTILPKVLTLDQSTVIDAMLDATEKFEQVTAYMIEADNTIKRSITKRNRK